jgi:hypothetical protein
MGNKYVKVKLSSSLIHAKLKTCDGLEKQFRYSYQQSSETSRSVQ